MIIKIRLNVECSVNSHYIERSCPEPSAGLFIIVITIFYKVVKDAKTNKKLITLFSQLARSVNLC